MWDVKSDFKLFLPPSPSRNMPGARSTARAKAPTKQEVINITRSQLNILDQYISRKERDASSVEPALIFDLASANAEYNTGEDFILRLGSLPTGQTAAADYQRLVFEIINYLFEPELTDGEMEVKTYQETERRDIIYLNEAERSFWQYVRTTYSSILVMFEIKNVQMVEMEHVNQTASYLGVRLGVFGFIVTRNAPGDNIIRKTYAIYNDTPSTPRKVILILCDDDLKAMIRDKQEDRNPTKYVQNIYRRFHQQIQ